MIDHGTRMLAVNLQGSIVAHNAVGIAEAIEAISERLGGGALDPAWPTTMQLAYVLALVIQHVAQGEPAAARPSIVNHLGVPVSAPGAAIAIVKKGPT